MTETQSPKAKLTEISKASGVPVHEIVATVYRYDKNEIKLRNDIIEGQSKSFEFKKRKVEMAELANRDMQAILESRRLTKKINKLMGRTPTTMFIAKVKSWFKPTKSTPHAPNYPSAGTL